MAQTFNVGERNYNYAYRRRHTRQVIIAKNFKTIHTTQAQVGLGYRDNP